ncbi:uncharacterized protein LOC124812790 isoform X2 [Hydra vulgaris]|uniref:uncharacterized protein LOC124812790 isoform X2 n=1 Tax=Hydra vulgaris TaxID=6087 RepID=UPI0032EA04EF
METLEFTSSIETAAESDEELSMPPAKKLAVCNTSDTEVNPSVSPRLKKSFNCQNILQPTTVRYIEPFSSNHSILISSSSDQSLATVVAALGTQFSEKSLVFPSAVSNQSIAGPSPSVQWNYLPVKEEKELLDLDEKLQNKDTYESLMNFLASVGGDDYKQLTTAILKQLLTKKVCLLYSLYGRKQKKSFSSLTSCKVVIAAIKKKFENANDKGIKERIGSFLATAIDRDGGRKNRTAIEQSPLLSDENECRKDCI